MSETIEEKRQRIYGKVILGQINFNVLITLIFLLSVYNISSLYFISMFTVFLIVAVKFIRNQERILNVIYLIFALILLVLPFNIFYEIFTNILLKNFLKNPVGLENNLDLLAFFAFYGLLSLFAILSEFIIILYVHYKIKGKTVIYEEEEPKFGTWDYFLTDTDYKKFIELVVYLTVAAIFEEIIFRFFLINALLLVSLPLIFAISISSIHFGLAHYGNGGWAFVVNSLFSGFCFSIIFIDYGFWMSSWLHFVWNFLIIAQMFFNYRLYR